MSSELADQELQPCPLGTVSMHGDEIAPLMARLPGWALAEGGRLERSFRFPDFVTAVAFVNHITTVAEAAGHHPDLLVRWGEVQVTVWTHSIGGLHINDFIVAARIGLVSDV
jgi:4a-hydroxytetrahydrobiopterin dehydratase